MFDTEKFITEVEKRPALYDVLSKEYRNREVKEQHWCDIGRLIYPEWGAIPSTDRKIKIKALVKKWKIIRDNFVKDYRLAALQTTGVHVVKKRRYLYSNNLQFLLPHIKRRFPALSVDCSISSDVDDSVDHFTYDEPELPQESPEAFQDGTEEIVDVGSIHSLRRDSTTWNNRTSCDEEATPSIVSVAADQGHLLPKSMATQYEEGYTDINGNKSFLMSFVPILNSLPFHKAVRARVQISQAILNICGHPADCTDECCQISTISHIKTESLDI